MPSGAALITAECLGLSGAQAKHRCSGCAQDLPRAGRTRDIAAVQSRDCKNCILERAVDGVMCQSVQATCITFGPTPAIVNLSVAAVRVTAEAHVQTLESHELKSLADTLTRLQ